MPCFAVVQNPSDKELLQISQRLKAVTDDQWNSIAGSKISEKYEIVKGDTLWDVSKRLFGNSYYWPKVWALNSRIRNPHILKPGQALQFTPATLETPPTLDAAPGSQPAPAPAELAEASNAQALVAQEGDDSVNLTAQKYLAPKHTGPKEFMKVASDRWQPEDYSDLAVKNYDEYGLDKELKVYIPRRFVARVPAIANDRVIPSLGEIVASRRDGVGLSERETIFLKSPGQDLQVGSSYSVLSEPEYIRERRSDRTAYIYQTIGEIRVIGIKDNLYIATITRAYDTIERGSKVYPLLPLITDIKPVPSRIALEALIITSETNTVVNAAQFNIVHFDRGIEDGVQVGNVFRIYTYDDPVNGKKITESDFLTNADALVVHATAQFCTAIVLRSRDTFARGDFGVTLTDVSDLEKQVIDRTKSVDVDENTDQLDKELDELDELDRNSGEGIGQKEQIEVKQLDNWDKSKGEAPADKEPSLDSGKPQAEPETLQAPVPEATPIPAAPEPTINPNQLEKPSQPSAEPPVEPIDTEPAAPPAAQPPAANDSQLDEGTAPSTIDQSQP